MRRATGWESPPPASCSVHGTSGREERWHAPADARRGASDIGFRVAYTAPAENRDVPRYGLQGVLPGGEHPSEDSFAFSLSGKHDIRLTTNLVASNRELDPGATFAFQVDQLDEGGGGTPGGVQSDTARHAIAINQSASQQLRPRSLAIT